MTMLQSDVLLSPSGRPLLICARCGEPLRVEDLVAQNLRLPEQSESREDYLDAELLDDLAHVECNKVARSA